MKKTVTIIIVIALSYSIISCDQNGLTSVPSTTQTITHVTPSAEVPEVKDTVNRPLDDILTDELEKAKKAFYDCEEQLQILVDEICLPENPEEFRVRVDTQTRQPEIIDQSPYPSDKVMSQIRQLAKVMEFTSVFVDEARVGFTVYVDWIEHEKCGLYIYVDYKKSSAISSLEPAEELTENWYITWGITEPG